MVGGRMTKRKFLRAMAAAGAGVAAGPLRAESGELIEAAEAGDEARVKRLIAQGAPVNLMDAKGRTALMAAASRSHVGVARALIDAGADVNQKDASGQSAYLVSGVTGNLEILRMTLARGADLKSTNDRYGGTALIPACERGHVEVVAELIAAGVNVNHVNRLGWTGLLEAIILTDGGPRSRQVVRLLIDAGADLNLADKDGVTPLQHARERGYDEIARMLQAAGAS